MLAAAALLATACGSGSSQSSNAKSTNNVDALPQYNYYGAGDNLSYYMALYGNFFDRYGFKPTVHVVADAQVLAPLVSGREQFAVISGAQVVAGIAEGAPIVIIGNTYPADPDEVWAAPSIRTVQDMKGQEVAVTSTAGAFVSNMAVALPKYGMSINDVKLEPFGTMGNMVTAGLAGKVKIVPVDVGASSAALKKAGWHLLMNEGDSGPFDEVLVATTRSEIAKHPDVVQRFMDAIVAATKALKTDPSKGLALEKSTTFFPSQEPTSVEKGSYEYYAKYVPCYPYATPAQFSSIIKLAGGNNGVLANPKIASLQIGKYLDDTFVKNAQKAKLGC